MNNYKKNPATGNLQFFEETAYVRDIWKDKNRYYWEDVENLCAFLIPEEAHVLEIGCGTGDLLAHIEASRKVGGYSPGVPLGQTGFWGLPGSRAV